MFGTVRCAIFLQSREAAQQKRTQLRIRRDIAQRSLPRRAGHDRQRTSLAGVIGAENHTALRNFQPRVYGACDPTGVNVSRVRSHTPKGSNAPSLPPGSKSATLAQSLI